MALISDDGRERYGHECPGCGTPGVPFRMLACRRCWFRLPEDLQSRIYESLRAGFHSGEHFEAIAACVGWYMENPL